MVAHLFIGLIIMAFASLFITQGKRRKIWSVLLLIALCAMSWVLIQNLNSGDTSGFIYQWLPYHKLKADFNISSSLPMQNMLPMLVLVLAGIIFTNIVNPSETYSLNISVLNLLSFVALILLASSHDFFQIMFACSILAILSFYIPNDIAARKRFFIYNFLAEISCFVALSIAYSSTGSISMNDLAEQNSKITHRDFVASLLMFSLFCKSGFFLFNGQYNALKNTIFNRLNGILVLSIPFSSLILLSKLHVLLSTSPLAVKIIPYWCGITFCLAGFSAVLNHNFNAKIIAWTQMIFSGMFYYVYSDIAVVYGYIPKLLIALLLSSNLLYGLALLSKQKMLFNNKWMFYCVQYGILLSGVLAFISLIDITVSNIVCRLAVYATVIIFGMIVKMLLSPVAFSSLRFDEAVSNMLSLYLLVLEASFISAVIFIGGNSCHALGLLATFAISFVITPAHKIIALGDSFIWSREPVENLYEQILLTPLKFFGRLLWLAFDFVFIERGIIVWISAINNFSANYLLKLQSGSFNSWFGWMFLGLIVLLTYAGVYAHD